MKMIFQTVTVAGLGLLASLLGPASAQAGGCCGGGGGGYRGGYGGGHTFNAGYHGGGMSCCNMGGMGMGMTMPSMAGMNTPPAGYSLAATPTNGGVKPAAATAKIAAAQYYCPMHPSVTSTAPGSCPYCGMTLQRR